MDTIEFAALTDVGRKREQNEDNFLVDKKLSLYVVCDGMGGHSAGEIASALAVRTVHDEVKKEKELLDDYVAGKKGGAAVTKRDILNMLEFAVNRASSRVHAEAAKDEKKRGMGTTIVGILFAGAQAFIVHVGDSRVYLLRDGVLEQVTEDHNVYNELIKRKKMTREQVEKLAPKNAITRAVGVYEHCEPESLVLDVTAGDRFLLCSDGLSQYFEDDLGGLALRVADPDADAAVKKLIDTANERGGSDNITAILITLGEAGVRDEDRAKKLQLKRDILARMPLFRPLNDREILRVLQVTDVVVYQDQEPVMTEGERGDELFIVLEGTVDVVRGDAKLASLSPGEHVGEMALIRSQPRSATVKSSGRSELMVIRRPDFFEILRNEHQLAVKLLWQFLGVLADRLADTSRELGAAREELAAEDVTQEIFFSEEDEDRQTARLPPPPPLAPDTDAVTSLVRETLLALALGVACAVACSEKRTLPPAPTSSAAATPPTSSVAARPGPSATTPLESATPSPPPVPSDAPREPLVPTTTCRAITVKGSVTAEGGKRVASGDVLDRPGWLDLGPSAELAVKHAETSREVVFHGPGRVLPCDRGEERFLMTRGQAITATWAGARPGSEVLIATPLAVVRYGDATLDVRAGDRTLSVQAAIGDAFIDVGDGTGGERVPAGKHAERKGDAVDVKALVAVCDAAARASETLARGVLSPGDSKAPLGERAAAHVRGRKAARMKCAIAGAALGTLEKGPDRDDLGRAVAGAEARWRGVPSAIRP